MKRLIKKFICFSFVIMLLARMLPLNSYALAGQGHHNKILIVAPHEDDEIIACAGVLRNAVLNGDDIKIIYYTNGDIAHQEKIRIQESIDALKLLDVSQDNIVYLGYGDETLYSLYSDKTSPNTIHKSYYNVKTTSFPDIGLYTYHYLKSGYTGVYDGSYEAEYTRNNFITDITNFIAEFKPDKIFCPAQVEGHTDHCAATFFTIEAILNLQKKFIYNPEIYEYMVYAYNKKVHLPQLLPYDPTVPVNNSMFDIDKYFPYAWDQRISMPVPAEMTTAFTPNYNADKREILPSTNLKYNAIHKFESQDDGYDEYERFIRSDEVFWKRELFSLSYNASVTSSSENTSEGQLGKNVIDGIFIGKLNPGFNYRANLFKLFEWATDGQNDDNAWIQLKWEQPITANQIKLYDCPNLDNNILTATLVFSDGTSIQVPQLNKNGTATVIDFPAKTFNSVKMLVDCSEGSNVGLSEFEVFLH